MPTEATLAHLASPEAHALHRRIRAEGSIVWVSALDGWMVTGRDAAIGVLRDAETFTVDDERFSTAVVVGTSMLSTDGEEHTRHRAPFVAPFARPRVGREYVASIKARAGQLVGDLAGQGSAELRTELAGPLAVAVITAVLGLVDVDEADVLAWYRSIVRGVERVSADNPIELQTHAALAELRACVAATSGSPRSLLSGVGSALAADEVFSNTAVLMFGAIETGEGMTANALWHLLTEPGLLELVRHNRSRVLDFIEESLRLEPAAAVVDRYATRDVRLADASICAGDFVRVSLAAANRDPQVFAEPDRFDLDRSNARQHLAFVQGPHACLGLHVARAQTAAAVNEVLDRLPGIELDRAASMPPSGLIFRKPQELHARW